MPSGEGKQSQTREVDEFLQKALKTSQESGTTSERAVITLDQLQEALSTVASPTTADSNIVGEKPEQVDVQGSKSLLDEYRELEPSKRAEFFSKLSDEEVRRFASEIVEFAGDGKKSMLGTLPTLASRKSIPISALKGAIKPALHKLDLGVDYDDRSAKKDKKKAPKRVERTEPAEC
jgi:hypothetical protein